MVKFFDSIKSLFPSKRADSLWISEELNYGTGKDRRETFKQNFKGRLSEQSLREFYRSNRMVRRIVNKLPDDMTREKYIIHHEQPELFNFHLERLNWYKKLNLGEKWARLFGGCALIIEFNDNAPLNMEVNFRQVSEIVSLRVVDCTYIKPELFLPFEDVTHYRLYNVAGLNGLIHKSRVIWLDGEETDELTKSSNQGCGESIINQLVDQLQDVFTAHGSASQVLLDFTTAVYKIQNFAAMQKSDKFGLMKTRLMWMNLTRSLMNAVAVDAEKESFERQTINARGLPELVELLKDWLAALTGMPKTLLFGTSPSGGLQSGDGQSEKRDWYDTVKESQERKHREPVETMLELITEIYNTPGEVPSFEFKNLWTPTQQQEIKMRLDQSAIDERYWKVNAISGDEIRENRFTPDGYSFATFVEGDLEPIEAPPEKDEEKDEDSESDDN